MYLEIKNIDYMIDKSSVQLKVLETFIQKKINKNIYKNFDFNQNIIQANLVDSQDLIEIIVFMEKKLGLKINIYKIGGKRIKITLNKLFKFYSNELKKKK